MIAYSRSPIFKMTSRSQYLSEAQQCLEKIIGPHELITLNEQEPLDFIFHGSFTEKMVIGDLSYGNDVIFKTKPYTDIHRYCITRPKKGTPVFKTEEGKFLSTSDNATIVSPYDKFEINIKKDCIQSFLSFNKEFIESVLADLIQRPIYKPLVFDHTMCADNPKILAWWNLLETVNNILFSLERSSYFEDLKKDFEYILVKSLILSQNNNYTEEMNEISIQFPEYLKKSIEYIKKNIRSDIDAKDLEYISGVSKQKLTACFKRYMGMSIHSYIKAYRLKCINHEILNSSSDINITYIALNWGIRHLGRFSKEYKEFFGESPSTTLKKMLKNTSSSKALEELKGQHLLPYPNTLTLKI